MTEEGCEEFLQNFLMYKSLSLDRKINSDNTDKKQVVF